MTCRQPHSVISEREIVYSNLVEKEAYDSLLSTKIEDNLRNCGGISYSGNVNGDGQHTDGTDGKPCTEPLGEGGNEGTIDGSQCVYEGEGVGKCYFQRYSCMNVELQAVLGVLESEQKKRGEQLAREQTEREVTLTICFCDQSLSTLEVKHCFFAMTVPFHAKFEILRVPILACE